MLAEALPDDAKIVTLDIGDEFLNDAKRNWALGKVEHKIEVMHAKAEHSLKKLLETHGEGSFDFIFIDADKVIKFLFPPHT